MDPKWFVNTHNREEDKKHWNENSRIWQRCNETEIEIETKSETEKEINRQNMTKMR